MKITVKETVKTTGKVRVIPKNKKESNEDAKKDS
jgi:hypothetical protein